MSDRSSTVGVGTGHRSPSFPGMVDGPDGAIWPIPKRCRRRRAERGPCKSWRVRVKFGFEPRRRWTAEACNIGA